jgi:hypothetical protein
MSLSPNNPPRRDMKLRAGDSTTGSSGSIKSKMQTRASLSARRVKGVMALMVLSLAFVALPGQAFAGDPCSDATANQYANKTQQCLAAGIGSGGGGQPAEKVAVPAASSGPSLPFTGLDVAALAVVAMALTGTGVVLRRLATMGDTEK